MATVTTTYTCEVCSADSSVRVGGVSVPDVPVSKKNHVVFMSPANAKREVEAGLANPIGVKSKGVEELAQEALLYAACPKCAARNPRGVAAQKRKVLHSRLSGALLLAICVPGAWYFPTFGLATPILALFFTLLGVYARKALGVPLERAQIFIGIAGPLAFAAFARAYPGHAWLVPFALLGPELIRPQAGRDFEWAAAAKRIAASRPQAPTD